MVQEAVYESIRHYGTKGAMRAVDAKEYWRYLLSPDGATRLFLEYCGSTYLIENNYIDPPNGLLFFSDEPMGFLHPTYFVVNEDSEIVYEDVPSDVYALKNGVLYVRSPQSMRWDKYDSEANTFTKEDWDEVCRMPDGNLFLKMDNMYRTPDGRNYEKKGDVQLVYGVDGQLLRDLSHISFAEDFSHGVTSPNDEGLVGIVDGTGAWLLPPAWEELSLFVDGIAPAKLNSLWGLIDETGAWVALPQWEDCWGFHNGRAFAKQNGLWGLVDPTGAWIAPPQWAYHNDLYDDRAFVMQDGLWGLVDKNGAWLAPPQWIPIPEEYSYRSHHFYHFLDGLAAVSKDDRVGFIDMQGNLIGDFQWEYIKGFSEGFAAVEGETGLWGFVGAQGEVIPPQWEDVALFHEGRAKVCLPDGWRADYIDTTGAPLGDYAWDWRRSADFQDGCARVQSTDGALESYINLDGELLFPLIFEIVYSIGPDMAEVMYEGARGEILRDGTVISGIKGVERFEGVGW